ncbi:hypothetical protein SISSUDRAFT_1130758 [Sistotremastrum suecicum HHB10207 ss-3]|uniref:Uncharacterized protein n=1 Tax=Sistotremastrum suecicum HHB10207 ss-3 TaxID=1314776 RepID=A0A166B263_9AGAM|nr:hypothetical protein SISSUDRAFT_1130758 [Sistotremastrum suecicum HHB10207 ss-3]
MSSATTHDEDDASNDPSALTTSWATILPPEVKNYTLQRKLYLIVSLIIHLNITITSFLTFLFSNPHPTIKHRVSRFTSRTFGREGLQFGPLIIWELWKEHFRSSYDHLVEPIVIPEALRAGQTEFSKAIRNDNLRLTVETLEDKAFRDTLNLGAPYEIYAEQMPFICDFMSCIVNTPNRYRKRKAKDMEEDVDEDEVASDEEAIVEEGPEIEGPVLEGVDVDVNPDDGSSPAAVADENVQEIESAADRNARQLKTREDRVKLAVTASLSNLLYTCNIATNYFPLLLGQFLRDEGASYRVFSLMHQMGLSVTVRTVDRLKEQISEEAVKELKGIVRKFV